MTPNELSRAFPEKLEELRSLLSAYECRPGHFVADTVLFGYGSDVHEHSEAVRILVESIAPRSAYANARSAFEAGVEMLYLVGNPDEYDVRGASARVWESREAHRHEQIRSSYPDGALKPLGQDATHWQDHVASDAAFCDSLAPGTGDRLRKAYQIIDSSKAADGHWSGLSRRELAHRAEEELGLDPGSAVIFISMYSSLSIHSHPRLRLGTRQTERSDDGRLLFSTREIDTVVPRLFATMACMAASVSISRRLTFVPSAA